MENIIDELLVILMISEAPCLLYDSINPIQSLKMDVLEEVRDEVHDHAAAGINLRRMSASQNQNFGKFCIFW